MKRLLCALTALLLCAALLAGCRNEPAPESTQTDAPTLTTEASVFSTEAPPVTTEISPEPDAFDMDAFLTGIVEDNPGADVEELCEAMLESPYFIMFRLESTEFYYPGLNWEYNPQGIRASSCIVDYMTASGALVYAVEPEEGVDAEALAEELEANANPNWMYSEAAPDRILSKVLDGKIFLAMYKSGMTPIEGPIAGKGGDFVKLFHDRRAEAPDEDCLGLANYLAGHQKLAGMFTASAVPGRLAGFIDHEATEVTEVTGFTDGACFSPIMGASPFLGYVFRLEDGADPDAFVAQLREKANLAWDPSAPADTVITETDGAFVLFLMYAE